MEDSFATKAYKILEEKIVTFELEPGSIVTEKELCNMIGIGRSPVREAIIKLENAHLIQIFPRKGIMISDIKFEDILLQLEVRKVLEQLISYRAAKYATKKERKKFFELSNAFEESVKNEDKDKCIKIDAEFNEMFISCSRNPFAASALQPLLSLSRRLYFLVYDVEDLVDEINEYHILLMRSIAEGKPEEASQIATNLVDAVYKLFTKNVDRIHSR